MTYTTIQGEMWDIISKNIFGSEFFVDALMKANPSYASTVIFSAGIILTIPDIDTITQFSDLPPWKRG